MFRSKRNLAITMLILATLLSAASFTFSSEHSLKKHVITSTHLSNILKQTFYTHSILQAEMLGSDVRDFFSSKYPEENPGWICGDFRGMHIDCAVLLVDTEKMNEGVQMLVVIFDANKSNYKIQKLEDYTSFKTIRDHVFLRYQPRKSIPNRETGVNVKMIRDGFEVVFFEQSSRVYYWENRKLRRIQTSD